MEATTHSELPPGFRFHPTDEELIMYYLKNQATSKPCPVSIIPEIDFYKFDPWELPEKTEFGENEWYFFTPRDRKYPNGVRPNRATVSGYWKATGTDKAIYSGSKYVGVKKALVFYKGKPPKGLKTHWIMHEYRLIDSRKQANKHVGSMRLDDWVLCRVYRKRQTSKTMELNLEDSSPQIDVTSADEHVNEEEQMLKFPRTWSISHLLDLEYLGPMSQLLNDNSYNSNYDFQNMLASSGTSQAQKSQFQFGETANQNIDSGNINFQVTQSGISNSSNYMNSMYDLDR